MAGRGARVMIRSPPLAFALLIALLVVGLSSPAGSASDPPFVDVPQGHLFGEAIAWLADQEITKGCNPPTNDRYCPDDFVTRAQMASFLVRTLYLVDGGDSDRFVDDDGSVHERDIDRLATAGITRGCNPPQNDRFCPEDFVTRGQMAAFLVRAFGLTDDGGGDLFVDDDHSIFERDIDRLATAGITRGCNPPQNDRFCPEDFVTRGQMAAFLWRAYGQPPVGFPGINRVDGKVAMVPGSDDVAGGSFIGEGRGRWVFSSDAHRFPRVGEIVIMEPTSNVPSGILGRVVSSTRQPDGSRMVETVPVPLQEVVPQVRVVVQGTLAGSAMQEHNMVRVAVARLIDWNPDCGGGADLRVEAPITVDAPDWDVIFRWGPRVDTHVRIAATLNVEVEPQATIELHHECSVEAKLVRVPLPPITALPGPPVNVELFLGAGFAGSAELAATARAEVHVTATVGGEWRDGQATLIRDGQLNAGLSQLTPDVAHGQAELLVGPGLEIGYLGRVSGQLQSGPYLRGAIDALSDPWWELFGGLKGMAELRYDFFIRDGELSVEVFRCCERRLSRAPTSPVDPTITVSPGSGPVGTQFTVSGSDFTSEGTVSVHLQRPDNGMSFPVDSVSTDGDGTFSHEVDSSVLDPATYEVWAVDDATDIESNVVMLVVEAGDIQGPDLVYAVSGPGPGTSGDLYLVDPSPAGADTLIGPVQTSTGSGRTMTDIALGHDGTMYGVRVRLSAEILQDITELYVVDPETATATLVGETAFMAVNGLEVSPDGRILGATSRKPNFTNEEGLVQFDPDTGEATLIGTFGPDLGSSGDLAFSPDGILYLSGREAGVTNDVLATVDPETGAATRVNPDEDLGYSTVFGLFFVADDLFGVTREAPECDAGALLRIDRATAIATFVRCLAFEARGATTMPQTNPIQQASTSASGHEGEGSWQVLTDERPVTLHSHAENLVVGLRSSATVRINRLASAAWHQPRDGAERTE